MFSLTNFLSISAAYVRILAFSVTICLVHATEPVGIEYEYSAFLEQDVPRLGSWKEAVANFEQGVEDKPFIIGGALTELWPIFSDANLSWNSLEHLISKFGYVDARIARGSRIGYLEDKELSVVNPLTISKEQVAMVKGFMAQKILKVILHRSRNGQPLGMR